MGINKELVYTLLFQEPPRFWEGFLVNAGVQYACMDLSIQSQKHQWHGK